MPFQLGGLSHHGATGHLGVPCPDSGRALENKPQLPWHDRRCHISLPSECQLRLVKRRSQLMMALQFKSIEISRWPILEKGAARKFSEATGQLPRTRAMGR